MSELHSYSEIFNLGHRAICDLLKYPLLIEEKIDGSQFTMSKRDGVLFARSKGQQLNIASPEKMFIKALESADGLDLHDGWIYRAEYLQSPKHNALFYSRVPVGHIILFDIERGPCDFLSRSEKEIEAKRIGLEVVPILFQGIISTIEQFDTLLNTVSILGGQKIEGVVLKPIGYDLYGRDKKVLMGKYVSEKYREIQKKDWKESNPGQNDILTRLSIEFKTEARWAKAIQHLRDAGQLEGDPKDIGKLIKEVPEDIRKECEDIIKEKLWNWAWPNLRRSVVRGFPEWYKEELLKSQFQG
jgi:hypothetical protein